MPRYMALKTRMLAALLASATFAMAPPPAAAETPTVLSHAIATDQADFDVYFPLRNKAELETLVAEQVREGSPQYHKWLKPAEFQRRFGASDASVARVTAELRAHGFTVGERLGHLVHVTAGAAAVERVFGVRLNHARFSDGSTGLVADRALSLTPALSAEGVHIPQFSSLAPMRHHSAFSDIKPDNFFGKYGPYYAGDLRQAYDVPSANSVTGQGVVIGILVDGGYNATDIQSYFANEGVPSSLYPNLATKPVNGGLPFSTQTSGETHLDIEQSAGFALGADELLYNLSDLTYPVVLFGLNLIDSDNFTDIVNMSFGGPEIALQATFNGGISQTYIETLYHELFLQGNSQGITFFASTGDHGANPLLGNTRTTTPELPAIDPNVTAVGGTNLITTFKSGSNNSAYVSEFETPDPESDGNIWASGGGISSFWAKPAYQKLVPTPSATKRTIPDLALHMGGCPGDATSNCGNVRSADIVELGGREIAEIGTSASSPDMAGIFALEVNLAQTRLGNINRNLYTSAKNQIAGQGKPFHHITTGSNGVYKAKPPYDLVVGNGTADVRQLLGAINLPASGVRGTASNP